MNCIINGFLSGVLCADRAVVEGVPGADLVAVPSRNTQTVAGAKAPVHEISETAFKQLREARGALFGSTDERGSICFSHGEYDGQRLDVYARIHAVPAKMKHPPVAALSSPLCLFLGTFSTQGDKDKRGPEIQASVPAPAWAAAKKRADVWTIVGVVETCRDKVPFAGARVTAFDADIIQDDFLGSADTDAQGNFRIDYLGAAFRKGTLVDVELFGGPDVYFVVKDSAGATLIEEDRAKGRTAGRGDSTPCLCVHLCADLDATVPGENGQFVTAWTGIGSAFTIPNGAGVLNDFDAEGYAGPEKYAFWQTLTLTGSAPNAGTGGERIEYRFLVSDDTVQNGVGAPPASSFTRAVGSLAHRALFASTRIGQMVCNNPSRTINISATIEDVDDEGWLDPQRAVTREFAARAGDLTLPPLSAFRWVDVDSLMAIDTTYLTALGHTKAALRFEIRSVTALGVVTSLPGNGTTLNSIVLDNAPTAYTLAAQIAGHECDPLSAVPQISYSVAHPHLRSVDIHVRSNDSSYSQHLVHTPSHLPLSNNIDPAIVALGPATVTIPTTGLKKCTYLVTLSIVRRLHDGINAAGAETPQTTFYYEPIGP